MTTILPGDRPTAAAAPRFGALVRSEVLRARSRRSLLWLTLLGVLGVLLATTLMWFTTGHVEGKDLEAASQRFLTEQQGYYDECMADTSIPESERADACWKPTAEDARASGIWMVPRSAFGQDSYRGLVALAGGIGLLIGLLLAATTGGADWGARTMGLALSWEPRRTRLFAVRLVLAAVIAVVVEALLVCLAVGFGWFIARAHDMDPSAIAWVGDSYVAPDLNGVVELAVRWLPLTLLASVGSFALAMLTRSTGWAIGASIGYVAVVESLLQGLWPWGSQWLLTTNIAAWLQGGAMHLVNRAAAEASGFTPEGQSAPGYIWISGARALATLAVVVVAGGLVSWISFRARDVE